jgi:hypothetical protein
VSDDTKFVRGLFYNPPHPKAPAYVKCSITLKRDALIGWMNQQDEDDKATSRMTCSRGLAFCGQTPARLY